MQEQQSPAAAQKKRRGIPRVPAPAMEFQAQARAVYLDQLDAQKPTLPQR